jgi:hypothetical protein
VFSSWHTDTHTAESGERDAAARRPHKPNDLDGRLMKRTETHAQPNNCERSSTDRKVRRTPHASHRAAPPPSLLVRIISIGLGDTRSPPTSVGQQPGPMPRCAVSCGQRTQKGGERDRVPSKKKIAIQLCMLSRTPGILREVGSNIWAVLQVHAAPCDAAVHACSSLGGRLPARCAAP